MLQKLRHLLELIRFSHTVFALPFALLSAVLAWDRTDSPFNVQQLVGIVLYDEIFAPGGSPLMRGSLPSHEPDRCFRNYDICWS